MEVRGQPDYYERRVRLPDCSVVVAMLASIPDESHHEVAVVWETPAWARPRRRVQGGLNGDVVCFVKFF